MLAGDPLGEKLVTFIRMLSPHQASADEILVFLAQNPDWPDQALLKHRFAEALADEPDAQTAARLCTEHPPHEAPADLRCAEVFGLLGKADLSTAAARAAWVEGVTQPAEEAAFLARWGRVPTEADQWQRFAFLASGNPVAADRQVGRLDAGHARLANALLAFRRQDAGALSDLASVPESLRATPDLLLAEAKFLRRTHAEDAALALWRTALPPAEAASPPALRPAFWAEREALAHVELANGQSQTAFALADDSALTPDQAADAEFLAGWIALRALKNAPLARQKFAALASHSHSAITQARAHYWLGRAAADDAAAKAEFLRAAAWPLTFYGQKAALASGETEAALKARIAGLRDPTAPPAEAVAVAGSELMRAAARLADWQDSKREVDFWLRQAEIRPDAAARALVAQAALRENMPEVAVHIARMAGHDGEMLPQTGWPIPLEPPPGLVPTSLVLGIMRQESSFDPKTVSPAGAHGLMQVMPQTAAELFRADHRSPGPLSDPAINMRLGTEYLAQLLNQFAGNVTYAVAAYDAGPHRVQEWITAPDEDTIDWIEAIPFAETRSYVQRVLENTEVYAAKGK